jgi:hypothetical protein
MSTSILTFGVLSISAGTSEDYIHDVSIGSYYVFICSSGSFGSFDRPDILVKDRERRLRRGDAS